MKIKDRITAMRRTFPLISIMHARYLYAKPDDMKKRGKRIVVWIVVWSSDGRVSLHRTDFSKARSMSVVEWGGWLQVNLPGVMTDNVLAYINRTFGSSWNIDRVFGWHFDSARKPRP